MKNLFDIKKILFIIMGLFIATACDDELTEMNINPNGIDPSTANPNLLMPSVLAPAAKEYLELGFNNIAGTMQHTQKNGWYSEHNHYDWGARDWSAWYAMLRTNDLMEKRAVELGYGFFEGVALTMKSFVFGNITDIWGDAPYTNAIKGNEGGDANEYPVFDSQEVIYMGIIDDLKRAADIFATADADVVNSAADLYLGGDTERWQRFANSLLLRYYMRISNKMPDVAKAGIEAVYNSGMYLQSADQDVSLDYTGGADDVWPSQFTDVSSFTRWQACQTLIDQLVSTSDPRISVWFDPVAVQWVADPALPLDVDTVLRVDGEPVADGALSYSYLQFMDMRDTDFTRRFNPNVVSYNTDEYVGLPPGLTIPESYNGNPDPGQGTRNQHVSQLAPIYATAGSAGDILKSRIISAAEVSFILAEAALKGWSVGSAEEHYNNAIQQSLEAWERGDEYADFITQPGVAFDGTLEQVITQKWVASWTAATEAWMDYRRTGFPELEVGPASSQPVVALRYPYGDDELNNNETNAFAAIGRLEVTPYSGAVGANSPWSKMWVLQGTSAPW
ncbi:SusD/RagB family nutrient-binding outer membrane lipoprotein [Catalinimonas niigatensis]|uniref:SusD/RagB family nutrient-binding outer membrane lipoprotein n=1 Tax=Catalinimonas niigatensis TaxID=1397264 RepID=UPI00266519E7|nr:SusD/RagB family nutrient-binding outer membrane lipoprotein [Catalinimonas niigatensis]WPP50446.1 SusD/RagB family nutrient-binding outer membrane lipoprotein [Catalinimonas niigatensis]